MSRTYKKCPIYRQHYKGEFYKWDDLPEEEHFYEVHKRVLNEEKTAKSPWSFPEYDYLPTGEISSYFMKVNAECVEIHNVRSRHPDDVKNFCGGVGKYNKQLRSRHERSRISNIIRKKYVIEENYDEDLPRERNHDRWDYW